LITCGSSDSLRFSDDGNDVGNGFGNWYEGTGVRERKAYKEALQELGRHGRFSRHYEDDVLDLSSST
jgi:hypothetical protein